MELDSSWENSRADRGPGHDQWGGWALDLSECTRERTTCMRRGALVCVSERLSEGHGNVIKWVAWGWHQGKPKLRHCHRRNGRDGRRGPVFHQIAKLMDPHWFYGLRWRHRWWSPNSFFTPRSPFHIHSLLPAPLLCPSCIYEILQGWPLWKLLDSSLSHLQPSAAHNSSYRRITLKNG